MSYTTVSFAGLQELEETVLVDVRNREEVREQGQIPNSHCIPLPELQSALAHNPEYFEAQYGFTKPGPDDSITTHCLRGGRARQAAQMFIEAGYPNVNVYEGSFLDWKQNGGEVINPGNPFEPLQTD